MSENNKREEISQKGNDWEVVALTESAYAAAPGPKNMLDISDSNNLSGDVDSETARAMFMSGHFGLSPNVHENFPLEPECKEKCSGEVHDHDVHQVTEQQDKEQGMYVTGKNSYNDAVAAGTPLIADEDMGTAEEFESPDDAAKSKVHKHVEEDKFSEPTDLPCDTWWRIRAASLYGHAKNSNPYWSLVVAAAVIGLVIIGRRWQRDRPQAFQLKSQLTIANKEGHWIPSPVGRVKGVNIGGRHGSYIGLSSVTEG
ncbi:ATG8-interacting protein 1-like isoform X3 [Salvia hispanica]|uniref:ATG8-interacting protein 1-like isoform X3 n=1 Tax=Salvia hispanica TaxID=49212 RepID=UPI002008F7CB|nr:ATG8-interacting protein 1-like isoform X3 [Salvia hispanica]